MLRWWGIIAIEREIGGEQGVMGVVPVEGATMEAMVKATKIARDNHPRPPHLLLQVHNNRVIIKKVHPRNKVDKDRVTTIESKGEEITTIVEKKVRWILDQVQVKIKGKGYIVPVTDPLNPASRTRTRARTVNPWKKQQQSRLGGEGNRRSPIFSSNNKPSKPTKHPPPPRRPADKGLLARLPVTAAGPRARDDRHRKGVVVIIKVVIAN